MAKKKYNFPLTKLSLRYSVPIYVSGNTKRLNISTNLWSEVFIIAYCTFTPLRDNDSICALHVYIVQVLGCDMCHGMCTVKCQVYTSKEDCESSRQGIRCVWADDKTCLSLSRAQALQGHKFIERYAVATCTPPQSGRLWNIEVCLNTGNVIQ